MKKTSKPEPSTAEENTSQPISTPLTSMAEQIGQHVISALNQADTIAVLTTITGSRIGRQVVSLPLDPKQMNDIQMLLTDLDEHDEPETLDCVGFHCQFDESEPEGIPGNGD